MTTTPSNFFILDGVQVRQRCAFSGSTLKRLVADGSFPRPVRLSERRKGWIEREVDDWIAARIAERDGRKAA